MALLITRDQYLIPLNNRQHCKSVPRESGWGGQKTISLLVYTKHYMSFFPTEFHTDLAWKLKVIKASK